MMRIKKLFVAALLLVAPLALTAQENTDWANTSKYVQANAKVTVRPRAVLFGDSITEGWAKKDPDFFTANNYLGRGISGQTTSQILVRMQQDVVSLRPKYVVILCGINDIAQNPGHAVNIEAAIASIKSMCDIAKDHKIKPVLCTLLPSYKIRWRKYLGNVLGQVQEFNRQLKDYARSNHIKLVDYYAAFADDKGRMPEKYSSDTVHPNLDGYKLMEECILPVLK